MCLAIPAQVTEITKADHAMVQFGEVQQEIYTGLVDNVCIGDYLIVHVGHALNKIDPKEAAKTLALFKELEEKGAFDHRP